MNITTTFGPGDKVWCPGSDALPHLRTVGQVRITLTDTPGMDLGDGIQWDNFKPHRERTEEYMCVETGVGCGSIYTLGKHAFATREECCAQILKTQVVLEQERNERECARQLDRVRALLQPA